MRKRLDRAITIQQKTAGLDALGGVTATWSTYSQPMAAILPKLGGDNTEDVLTFYDQPIVFMIRYDAGIAEDMRILHDNGRYYEIKAIEEMGRREMLKITATWASSGATL